MLASEKIQETAIALRSPKDGAEGPELALATLVQGLTTPTAQGWIQEAQKDGELDRFMAVLGQWIMGHRSDDRPLLVTIEMPRGHELPAGTILHRVEEARQVALAGPPDLSQLN
ncbi:MAG TPA: hypothetical protein VJ305_06700 [Streptosporangiaceae bacterium]|nr:hypothetical protein [Streptosporangiaceae bacterium]